MWVFDNSYFLFIVVFNLFFIFIFPNMHMHFILELQSFISVWIPKAAGANWKEYLHAQGTYNYVLMWRMGVHKLDYWQ